MIDPSRPVAELVLEHPECAALLTQHRVDFCCRGEQSLASACAALGLDLEAMRAALSDVIARAADRASGRDPRTLSTPALIAHVITTYHEPLRQELVSLEALAAKVARVHGAREARLGPLAALVVALRDALLPHLDEEEQSLFPAMMMRARDEARLARELDAMMSEHLAVGELLAKVRQEAEGFVAPDWACASYRALMRDLAHLEADVLTHVHLENHVLRPRFVAG